MDKELKIGRVVMEDQQGTHKTEGAREKILANHISARRFVSRIYKELLPLNNKKINNSTNKWRTDLKRQFSIGDIQMASTKVKRCSISLALRKTHIKTIRYHFTPSSMAIIKKDS